MSSRVVQVVDTCPARRETRPRCPVACSRSILGRNSRTPITAHMGGLVGERCAEIAMLRMGPIGLGRRVARWPKPDDVQLRVLACGWCGCDAVGWFGASCLLRCTPIPRPASCPPMVFGRVISRNAHAIVDDRRLGGAAGGDPPFHTPRLSRCLNAAVSCDVGGGHGGHDNK
jgi:hypothetical protein